jgi:hypothetical protein
VRKSKVNPGDFVRKRPNFAKNRLGEEKECTPGKTSLATPKHLNLRDEARRGKTKSAKILARGTENSFFVLSRIV